VSRRRFYPPLKRPDEEEREPAGADVADPDPQPAAADAPPVDSLHARVLALQQGAGNAETGRLLRKHAARQGLAREPEGSVAPPGEPPTPVDLSMRRPGAPAAPLDIATMTKRYFDQLRRESAILHGSIVPQILDRLAAPPQIGTTESLAEITLLARDGLDAYLRENVLQGEGSTQVASPVADIQQVVMIVARQRNLIIPGHRSSNDKAGLESEANALAGLSGLKLPNLAIEGSAAGFKFRFDGELAASRKIGGAGVSVKGGLGGVEGSVKGSDAGVTAGGSFTKDSAKVDLKLTAGPVELKGNITAKSGAPTTWSAALEVKIGPGDPVPDPAALTSMIQAAGNDVTEAAKHLGSAVAGSADLDKKAIEEKLKPAKESIEKVAGYIQKHKAGPGTGPRATFGVTAKGAEDGAVSATVTLTIAF
jgi:hypothetical protein